MLLLLLFLFMVSRKRTSGEKLKREIRNKLILHFYAPSQSISASASHSRNGSSEDWMKLQTGRMALKPTDFQCQKTAHH